MCRKNFGLNSTFLCGFKCQLTFFDDRDYWGLIKRLLLMRDSYELRVWWPMNASHTSSHSKAELLLEQSSRLAAKTTDSLIAFKPCRDNSKHSVSITFSDWLQSGKETEIMGGAVAEWCKALLWREKINENPKKIPSLPPGLGNL